MLLWYQSWLEFVFHLSGSVALYYCRNTRPLWAMQELHRFAKKQWKTTVWVTYKLLQALKAINFLFKSGHSEKWADWNYMPPPPKCSYIRSYYIYNIFHICYVNINYYYYYINNISNSLGDVFVPIYIYCKLSLVSMLQEKLMLNVLERIKGQGTVSKAVSLSYLVSLQCKFAQVVLYIYSWKLFIWRIISLL